MKTRIALFLASLVLWSVLYPSLIRPTVILVRQSAAVATVANSNVAYVAQQTVEQGASVPWFAVGVIVLSLAFFARPVAKAFSS